MASDLTFLHFGELHTEEEKGRISLSLLSQTLPVAGVIKGEVHTEVRLKGPAFFPRCAGCRKLWGGRGGGWWTGETWTCGRQGQGWPVYAIKGAGWGGGRGGGEFFALLRVYCFLLVA